MVARLHSFTPTYYIELAPEDHAPNDPRRPRILYRGPTVEELLRLVQLGGQMRASDDAVRTQSLDDALDLAQACALRVVGDWGWCGLAGTPERPNLRTLIPRDAMRLIKEVTLAGQPEEVADAAPLGAGPGTSD